MRSFTVQKTHIGSTVSAIFCYTNRHPVTDFVTCIYLSRIQIKKLNKGVHKLIILHARLTDAGDVTCRCVGQNETTAKLTVNKLQPPDGDAGDQETGDGKVRARGKGNRRSFSIEIIYQKSANYFWKNHENFLS